MQSRLLVSLVILLFSTFSLSAQQLPRPGDRVRVRGYCDAAGQFVEPSPGTRANRCAVVGSFRAISMDSLGMTVDGKQLAYPLDNIDEFALSRGVRPHTLLGTGIGFVVGSGIAYLIVNSGGSTSLCDHGANQDAIGTWECVGVVALGGGIGAGLGAIIGSRIQTERWSSIPVERLTVTVGATRIGLAVGIAF